MATKTKNTLTSLDKRKIVKDVDFVPSPLSENDECFPNGIFHFNISALSSFLDGGQREIPITELDVYKIANYGTSIDESHLENADLARPVILAEISPGMYNLIDGHHRAEQARRNAVVKIPCYRVPPAIHTKFITSVEAYSAFVDYWNGKLNEQ